ncbi:MAG: glycosyltransferase family 39 protein [Proteobacteria bacterium]|nr:glycosyltransferase family 39 protein [Pseudomonadota bacterium]
MQATQTRDYFWLAAILALAAILRIWGLNAPMWHDEIQTVVTHLDLNWADMVQNYSMNHHYLHNFAAKASMEIFGREPWAIRLPAMLLGLGVVAATWVLAREMAGATIAHITAVLLALSYHEIWFSQNARGYTGLAFFSTLGMLFFLRGLREPKRSTWIAFGLSLAAAVFTHLTGAFFFMAQGLVWLGLIAFRARKGTLDAPTVKLPFLGFMVGGILSAIVYLPLVPSLLSTVGGVSETSATDVMQEYQNPLWTAMEAIRTGVGHAGAVTTITGLAVLALSLLGAYALRRREPLFGIVTFGHIVLTALLLMAVGMRIWPRFFFVDIGLLMLLIVLGVRSCCEFASRALGQPGAARALFILGVIGMVGISALLAKRNYILPKQGLEGAYVFVRDTAAPGERTYSVGYAGEGFRDWYQTGWPILFTNDDYLTAMAEPGPVVLVVGFPERTFRDVPQLAADADAFGASSVCETDRTAPVLKTLGCFGGTLGDGNVIVLRRD